MEEDGQVEAVCFGGAHPYVSTDRMERDLVQGGGGEGSMQA